MKIDWFDIVNKIKKNKLSIIDFEWLTNNINIDVDLFDINIAKNVNIANSFNVIIANSVFDIKKRVNVAISFVVIKLNNTIITNSITTNFSISFE